MSEINNALISLTDATEKLILAKESFEAIRQDADSAINEASSTVDAYISGVRGEYSRFNHYVPLEDKVSIPALGLSNDEIDAYSYIQLSDYTPARSDGTLCFADIPEFGNGFSDLTIPDGMSAYLHLLVNVVGANTSTMYTKVHLLRENKGQGGYHYHSDISVPYVFNNEGTLAYQIEGRNWGDSYKDRNELKISNFNKHNNFGSATLRILNLGDNGLEIFGIGIEVRV